MAHVVKPRVYLAVIAALMVMTATTVAVAYVDLGVFNDIVAIGIAVSKTTLVVLFFMHVKYSSTMVRLCVVVAVIFLVLLLGITWTDYWGRGLSPVAAPEIPGSAGAEPAEISSHLVGAIMDAEALATE